MGDYPNSSPRTSVGVIAPNVLEAPQRGSPGECDHGNTRKRHHDAYELGLHGKVSYQPLTTISVLTLDPPLRPSCSKNTKTDRTCGSVGCTTRSAPPQVPISGGASARPSVLTLLPSTGVLRSPGTIWSRE